MSKNCIILGSLLLKEHFGEIVQKVATVLFARGSRPLKQIASEAELPLEKVKKALCVLIQHNMVEYELSKPGLIEYKILIENVLLFTRYPRYIYCAKTLYGDLGELLVEELLNNGQMTMEAVIDNVSQRLAEAIEGRSTTISVSSIKEKFSGLVQSHFIQRCPSAIWEENALLPRLILDECDMFKIPDASAASVSNTSDDSPPSKKLKTETNSTQTSVYWCVNTNRFHQYFRDQAIISAVVARFDIKAGEVVRALLRIAETTSNPWAATTVHIARFEMLQSLLKDTNILENEMDCYLAILTDDSVGFVSKADDRAGGMYIVNTRKALQKLAEAIAVSVVQERYGSKCCRIFRLLLMKKYLEQKQIEELAMILSKDAKDYTYRMLKENFITVQEIPRTSDHAPSRTFYLFHVDLNQLCRLLLDQCYKAIFNSISRRKHETKEHKRLLEKKQRVDAIIATLQQSGTDSSQIQEVEDMISPSEHAQLERVKHTTNKLDYSEIQVDETIFILSMWLESLNK